MERPPRGWPTHRYGHELPGVESEGGLDFVDGGFHFGDKQVLNGATEKEPAVRLLIQHRSLYQYPKPAYLGPHMLRLRPADHTSAIIENYSLSVEQAQFLHWTRDPYGNRIARCTFDPLTAVERLDVLVELSVNIKPVNPFDFFIEDAAEYYPFNYSEALRRELAPFFDLSQSAVATGPLFEALLSEIRIKDKRRTIDVIVDANRVVNSSIDYVIRNEPGVWTPEETLRQGRGSCRDSAMLLTAVLRRLGLAARFTSGYLIQVTDEGMLPDLPKGLDHDVVDLHAWAEVYLPGGGWIGLDATSGLLTGEGHIPLACASEPSLAAPLEGTADQLADSIDFSMSVARLGHEPRPTVPYEEHIWESLVATAKRADQRLQQRGVVLTMGGEPTFNSHLYPDAPEWNADALGPTKWTQGVQLANELRKRFTTGGILLHRMGKHYPGESLPRWMLDIYGRRDRKPLWHPVDAGRVPTNQDAERLMDALRDALGLPATQVTAYEDPWHFLHEEAKVPTDIDPMKADLENGEERRRLARVLNRGMRTPSGYAIPLGRSPGGWFTGSWNFRRGYLFLIPGDAPLGLRLPLNSIAGIPLPVVVTEEPYELDPRVIHDDVEYEEIEATKPEDKDEDGDEAAKLAAKRARKPRRPRRTDDDARGQALMWVRPPPTGGWGLRTALCTEVRNYHGTTHLFVFLPPVERIEYFIELIETVDAVANRLGLDVMLEGYPPPRSQMLTSLAVTPDPGVLEVNMPVTDAVDDYLETLNLIYEAALHSGLHTEKYQVDGRQAGSGGGHHLTLGGPTPMRSPFLLRPETLGRLLNFIQHHPSLSYMFTGLFVGPTSQAPRVDEARHETIYELELAISRAAARKPDEFLQPWYTDMLFRHLLIDVTGNTHRAEVSIDKLFDPLTVHGRQGILEFRAFEMPPHPRMAAAQMLLMRTLFAAIEDGPYRSQLVRWGQSLHDRFLLPYWMWKDFEDVLDFLNTRGYAFRPEHYRPFLDLRCPIVGSMAAGGVTVEVRNAIEPWHVLGEEATGIGTSRYVDSSLERIEILVDGYIAERHAVLVNGHTLPLRATGEMHRYVGGVRFRAWAPPHSLQPHIGIHHPIRIDLLDRWSRRSLAGSTYHVWHPEGRGFDSPPLTRFEAAARRTQRFTLGSHSAYPVNVVETEAHPDAPYTLDLRRFAIDRPPPEPTRE